MVARLRLDSLGSDPQLVARLSNASFNHQIRGKTLAHLTDVDGHALELEGRCARDHIQPWNMRQRINDFFRNSVAEVVLLWLRTHVYERQHGNRSAARLRG